MCRRGDRIYTSQKQSKHLKGKKIDCQRKVDIFNVRFSFADKETEEHTTLSSIVEINL
jgi:hypothetical protein